MNWLIKTKKYLVSIFSLGIIIVAYFLNENFRNIVSKDTSESIFWLTVPVFVFSLIAIFIKDLAWNTWFKFSLIFYFIFLIISLAPISTAREFAPSESEIFIYGFFAVYTLISIILIIYKSVRKS